MDGLMKYYETTNDITYVLGDENQSIVSIPKDLANHIKIFVIIKDKSLFEHNRNNIVNEIFYISKMINNGNNDAIYLVSFVNSNLVVNQNEEVYSKEINRIKEHVNIAYNSLLRNGSLNKGDFIRKVQLISLNNKFANFINWTCMKNPTKFRAVNYQAVVSSIPNEQVNKNPMFIDNNSANIFSEPTRQSAMVAAMHSNGKPINEALSIGTPRVSPNMNTKVSANNGGYFKIKDNNVKSLSHTPSVGGQGFIKWPTIIFIMLITLLVSFTITVFIIK